MSDDIFDDKNIPTSNWFAFEKVGDKVSGVVDENPYIKQDTTGVYGDQKVFKLLQEDGSTINVGIKMTNKYIIERTQKVRRGDKVGFLFEKEIPPKQKGYNPAKSIQAYVQLTEEGERERAMEKDFS